MTRMNHPTSKSPEPLPGSFEPDIRRLDARLAQEAKHCELPPGLAGRVFDASVGQLPPSGYRFESIRKTTSAARQTRRRRQSWSRFALAASVIVAFTLSARMLLNQSMPAPVDPVAKVPEVIQPTLPNLQLAAYQTDNPLSPDVERLLLEFASNGTEDLSYLTLTWDITLDDLNNELAAFFTGLSEGEM